MSKSGGEGPVTGPGSKVTNLPKSIKRHVKPRKYGDQTGMLTFSLHYCLSLPSNTNLCCIKNLNSTNLILPKLIKW